MTLFVSDLHLGRGTPDQTRAAEMDVVAMLRAHESELLSAGGTLVLLGDVFDQYIEYRHLVPKGAVRLNGLLADWADRGASILYAVGNRDPWHQDYFEREVGLRVVRNGLVTRLDGRSVYIHHGDSLRPAERLSNRFRTFLRADLTSRLYRMCLPGDSGFALARAAARRFGTDGTPDLRAAKELESVAIERLAATDADVVAFGHVHTAALRLTEHGTYVNPGYWFGARTFARLDVNGVQLCRWSEGRAVPFVPVPADG